MPAYATPNLRAMLIDAGAGQYTADLSIPYMNMLPSTCEPYAQGVLQLVEGLQRLLNRAGYDLEVDGGLGERTARVLERVSGPRWQEKAWAQLYGDAMSAPPAQGAATWKAFARTDRVPAARPVPASAMSDYLAMGDAASDAALLAQRDALVAQRGNGWCTVAHPIDGCTPVAGVAKPANTTTLAAFQQVQQQLNRFLAHALRATSISVDGRIGASTVKALAAVKDRYAALKVALPATTVDQIAASAATIAATLRAFADGFKLPTQTVTVAITTLSPPSYATPEGFVVNPSDAAIAAANAAGAGLALSNPLVIAALVVGGALALKSMRGGKRRRR